MILELLLSAALTLPAQPADAGELVRVSYADPAAAHRVALPALSRSRPRFVTVARGDTLSKLAREHGLPSWRVLYDANRKISNPNLIYAGQRLRVPREGERFKRRHVVRAAEPRRTTTYRRAPVRSKPTANYATGSTVWDRLAQCEASGNWAINTGNGFYGGLQFTPGSWRAAGGHGMPHQASRAEQIRRGKILQRMQGWGAWPACSRKLGLR